jgi:hypothetical protein
MAAALSLANTSCSLFHNNSQKKAEKKKASVDKKAVKEYEKARQQHLKNQSKSTIRMMKKTKKRAAEVNAPKKRSRFSGKKCY